MEEKRRRYQYRAVCVDFDGVLAQFSGDIESFGRLIPGSAEALAELRAHGYKIIIHTARPARDDHLDRLAEYLTKEGVPFDEINTNSASEWPSCKPPADLYIDDRALRFEGDWTKTLAMAKRYLGLNGSGPDELSYEELLSRVVHRADEVGRFEEFLRNETSWLTAPASTRFHLAKEGGLVEHSVNVARTVIRLRDILAPDLSEESCVIVGLYHDVGKVGAPGKPYYLPNPSKWHVKHRGICYIINEELVHLDLATRSLHLVGKYLTLSEDEIQAIRYHDGQYIRENGSVAHKETRLTRLMQYADNWSGGMIEGEAVRIKSAEERRVIP